jgi:predicted HicB family RNase H-like nuclease
MGESRKKYDSDIVSKKRYNSKLSSFQITKELHSQIKYYCAKNNLKVRNFIEETLKEKLEN